MNTEEMLEIIFLENEYSQSTRNEYRRTVQYFEEITGQKITEVMELAETEHQWKTSNLRRQLLRFRNEMNRRYKKSTATEYYGKIIAILNHFEIEYGKLPKMKKQAENILRDTSEIPSQKTLKKCVELKNNIIVKSTTLLFSSTGLSPVDLLKMTINDYLIGTSDYHNYNTHHNIQQAIVEMDDQQVVAMFKGNRQKTGTEYITFTSPESITATNNYLLSREDQLTPDKPLFQISRRTLNKYYQDINDQLGLGVTSEGTAKYSPKNLRSFHATQLEIAGMSDSRIDILEGRKPSTIIRKHYIKINTDTLREDYIRCLPYLVVDDMEKIKTELDIVKEENKTLKEKNEDLEDLKKRVLALESDRPTWDEFKKR
jgi:hypothetical protein